MFLMRIYHKIQMTFFQNFDLVNIKENSKNGYGIIYNNVRGEWNSTFDVYITCTCIWLDAVNFNYLGPK